jgi:uncharacterized protein
MLGSSSPRYWRFALGNVKTHTLADVLALEGFQRLEADIAKGVERCRASCAYFPYCGGGRPSNKYFENGTFASTETLDCRLHNQMSLDVSLERLQVAAVLECRVEDLQRDHIFPK